MRSNSSKKQAVTINKPTGPYIAATWCALVVGISSFLIGLWNAEIALSEKGFYLAVFLLGLFSSVTLQKSVRDRNEGFPVTNVYLGITWFTFAASVALLTLGLYNAQMMLSEKGFYGISFILSLFAVITVQKNIRDLANSDDGSGSVFSVVENGIEMASDILDN